MPHRAPNTCRRAAVAEPSSWTVGTVLDRPAEPIGQVARTVRVGATKFAICIAVVIGQSEAQAKDCAPASPECHLQNGRELMKSDPRRAADELLASYRLDERTDTLELYASALEADKQYAAALETWKRVIVFRDSEITAAKELAAKPSVRKRAKARADLARAQKQSEQAAEAIIKLWPKVGKVKIKLAPGERIAVWRGGLEVDATRDVLVNAGRDELVFKRADGSESRVVIEVAGGGTAKVDAPRVTLAKPAPKQAEPLKPAPVKDAPEEEAPADAEPQLAALRFEDKPRSQRMSRIGLGLVAGGVVAGALAGTFGYLSARDYDRAKEIGCGGGECPVGPAADLAERSNDRARFAQISAIGGGALIATGVTLWIVGRRGAPRRSEDVTLRVGPSSAAIGWGF